MKTVIKNLGIATKTSIAPALFFFAMVIVGFIAISSLMSINTKVENVSEDLAKDAITANELLDQIYQKRMTMKNYRKRTVTASTFPSEICHPILFGQSKRITTDDKTRSKQA
jgi:hypothetical protein